MLLGASVGWCWWAAGRAPRAATVTAEAAAEPVAAPPPRVASSWLREGPCEIQPLRASHRGCGVDPRLAGLGPLFRHAPWTAYSCFEPEAAPLPTPAVELRPHGRDGRRSIRLRAGRTTYTVGEGNAAAALVATRAVRGDVHILALRCQ